MFFVIWEICVCTCRSHPCGLKQNKMVKFYFWIIWNIQHSQWPFYCCTYLILADLVYTSCASNLPTTYFLLPWHFSHGVSLWQFPTANPPRQRARRTRNTCKHSRALCGIATRPWFALQYAWCGNRRSPGVSATLVTEFGIHLCFGSPNSSTIKAMRERHLNKFSQIMKPESK